MVGVGARLAVVFLALCSSCARSVEAATVVTVGEAIERMATDRLGRAVVRVEVEMISSTHDAHSGLVAVPDPQALVGRQARFLLLVEGRRLGHAVAVVHARARLVRLSRSVVRGERIEADGVEEVEVDVPPVRFARLLPREDIVGARVLRTLERQALVTAGAVAANPAVQTGDHVKVELSVGQIHVTADGVVSGSGEVGDLVRVLPAGRRGLLKARVVERGVVEVVP
jgi:flagella basal body P-ring formation protein FlgA